MAQKRTKTRFTGPCGRVERKVLARNIALEDIEEMADEARSALLHGDVRHAEDLLVKIRKSAQER